LDVCFTGSSNDEEIAAAESLSLTNSNNSEEQVVRCFIHLLTYHCVLMSLVASWLVGRVGVSECVVS